MHRYRKPEAICAVSPALESISSPSDVAHFVASEKSAIERRIAALGLRLRLANVDDIEAIQAFQRTRFAEGTLLEDAYVLYRIIRFGCAPLIETSDGRIVGCVLSEGYDDAERTQWGIRNSVDESVSGSKLQADLAAYASLIGMARGSLARRAFVSAGNPAAMNGLFNHVGFIAEDFDLHIPGHGPRFVLVLPLTPAGLRNNRVDLGKVAAFISERKAGEDYQVVATGDIDALARMYRDTGFRAVAFLKAGTLSNDNAVLGLPESALAFSGI